MERRERCVKAWIIKLYLTAVKMMFEVQNGSKIAGFERVIERK